MKEVWHYMWSCYASRAKFSSVKRGLKFPLGVAQGWISSLWLKSLLSFCNWVLCWRVTNELSWTKEGESAGGNPSCVLQASLSSNSQRRYVVRAHKCGSSDATGVAFITGSPWLRFKYARQKQALLLNASLTLLFPDTLWFDLLQSRPRSKHSNFPHGLQPIRQTRSSMQTAATLARQQFPLWSLTPKQFSSIRIFRLYSFSSCVALNEVIKPKHSLYCQQKPCIFWCKTRTF